MLKKKLREFSEEIGLDMVGIASMDRFDGVSPEKHPLSIFPKAKSVVVIAQEIPRGAFRGIEEGTLWTRVSRQVSPRYVYEIARFLEDNGWEGVPMSPLSPERWPDGVPVKPGKVAPNVSPSLDYAAVAAGLGEIGFCRVFLSPKFGPRQSLGMIITDAPLEPDPLCTQTICDRQKCLKCVEACPLGAIDSEHTEVVSIAGKDMLCGKLNLKACRLCPNGAFPDETSKKGIPNILTALCVRTCITHLEEAGKLSKKYRNPFRKGTPWKLGIFNRNIVERRKVNAD